MSDHGDRGDDRSATDPDVTDHGGHGGQHDSDGHDGHDDDPHADHEIEGELDRVTAPMQEFSTGQAGMGLAVLVVGLLLTFGLAFGLVGL